MWAAYYYLWLLPCWLQMLGIKVWPTFMVATSLLYFRVCFLVTGDPADSYHKLTIRDHAEEMCLCPLMNARLTLYTLMMLISLCCPGQSWVGMGRLTARSCLQVLFFFFHFPEPTEHIDLALQKTLMRSIYPFPNCCAALPSSFFVLVLTALRWLRNNQTGIKMPFQFHKDLRIHKDS